MKKTGEKNSQKEVYYSNTKLGETALLAHEDTIKSGEAIKPKKVICMEIYPFSLEEENSEQNVLEKIQELLPDYKKLGINTIWLAPVYPSPRKDMGYDVANYEAIDNRFGTLDDFDNLISEAHNQNQKVLMDLVLNHTSIKHEWFQKALSGDLKYRNFYYFTSNPQDDWKNFFDNQSAWAPVPGHEEEYYLHSFHKEQADLRWFDEEGNINEDLLSEFEKIINFWTKEHHVDGFRLDVPQAIDKDFSKQERNAETLMFGDGKQSSLVIKKLFANRPELLSIIEVFDPTDEGLIMSRYAGPGKPIQFAMNAFLAQQPESTLLEIFLKSLKKTPFLMIAIQSHDTPRKDTDNEILIELFKQNPQAVCLFLGEELNLENPSKDEFSDGAFFESDAQAKMQLDAKIAEMETELGRPLHEEEKNIIIDSIRSDARANGRASIEEYKKKLEEQLADPDSQCSRLGKIIRSWLHSESSENSFKMLQNKTGGEL